MDWLTDFNLSMGVVIKADNDWRGLKLQMRCIAIATRDCNPGILNTGIPDHFSIPKSRDYGRPNPGISGLENNVLTLLLRVKCMH